MKNKNTITQKFTQAWIQADLIVEKIRNHFVRHRKQILMVGLCLVVTAALFAPHAAFAATIPAAAKESTFDSVANEILKGASMVMALLQGFLWPILLMIGGLMQNDILYSPGMEEKLLLVWGNIRNVVNIIFVLILLGIALYSVVGGKQDYNIKTMLPKFVIALIAVNFTYVGIKVALDAVNVVSTALFALPNTVEEQLAKEETDPNKVGILTVDQINSFCHALYGKNEEKYDAAITKANADNPNNPSICVTKKQAESNEPKGLLLNFANRSMIDFFKTFNSRNAALVLAIDLQKINLLDDVKIDELPDSPSISTLALKTLVSIVLYVVYGTAFVALFITMLYRVVVLWLLIAISPLIALKLVLPESLSSGLGGGESAKFVKTITVPIYVSLILSIGFILLDAFKRGNMTDLGGSLTSPTVGFNLLTSGLGTLQELIVAIGTVGFVWMAVFESMKGTFAEEITGSVKSFVGNAGKAVAQLPWMAPIFPTATGGISLGAMKRSVEELERVPGQLIQNQYGKTPTAEFIKGLGGGSLEDLKNAKDFNAAKAAIAGKLDMRDPASQKALAEWINRNKNDKEDRAEIQKLLAGTGYNDIESLTKALEAGIQDPNEIKRIMDNGGISQNLSAGTGETKSAVDQAKDDSKQNAWINNRDEWVKKGFITKDEAKKLAEAKDKKTPEIEALFKKIEAADEAEKALNTSLLGDAFKDKDVKKENYDQVNQVLDQQVEALTKAGYKQEEAEKLVYSHAAELFGKNTAQKDKWKPVADGKPTIAGGKKDHFGAALNTTPPAPAASKPAAAAPPPAKPPTPPAATPPTPPATP